MARKLSALLVCLFLLPSLVAADLYEQFKNPPSDTRPFARWWWNGSYVTQKEILRELDVMKQAGIGGVEINTIGMPEFVPADSLAGFKALDWLSPEWNRMVRIAADGVRDRGMIADLIVGSGWPFGGRFLAEDEQTQRVSLIKKRVVGPSTFQADLKALVPQGRRGGDEVQGTMRWQFARLLRADATEFQPGEDLLPRVKSDGRLEIEVPAGEYDIYCGVLQTGFTHVKLGAPGADGPVVDHFNAKAVRKYLQHMSSTLSPELGGRLGDRIRAMFVDSLELDHANWTSDLPSEFERRRGYRLEPYLPFILDMSNASSETGLGDTARRARYDFNRTLVELFGERFLQTYAAWCKENGVLSRIQAYGRESHPLEGSLLVDLPEGESWLWAQDPLVSRSPTVANRYVSSAAHLSGKRRVSYEAMTNAVPVFRELPEDFKVCYDQSLLTGVMHPILHGFNYSPPEAGFPGWVRFGSYLNEKNPWWPYFRRFSDYAARLCAVFSQAETRAEIALLGPRPDEWSRHGLLYQPFPEVALPWYQYHLPQALQQHGLAADFVSERILEKAKFTKGQLQYGAQSYQALLLLDVESIELSAVEALERYVASGGQVAFVGKVPSRSPGLRDVESTGALIKSKVRRLLDSGKGKVVQLAAPDHRVVGKKDFVRTGLADDDREGLLQWTGSLLTRVKLARRLEIARPSIYVAAAHFRTDDRDFFFFSNDSRDRTIEVEARFNLGSRVPWKWDPETGGRFVVGDAAKLGALPVVLGPAESLLLVMEATSGRSDTPLAGSPVAGGLLHPAAVGSEGPIAGWDVEFQHVRNDLSFTRKIDVLLDLSKARDDAQLSTFGGTAVYRTKFDGGASGQGNRLLDLGKVHGISEVLLNGRPLGVRWYGRHVYDVGDALNSGTNELEIRVTTMLGNYCKSIRETNPVARRWAHWFPPIPAGLEGPVALR